MSISAAQLKASIPAEVGDVTTVAHPTGLILENIDVIWGMFDDYGTAHPQLQYLFALRKAYDYLIGYYSRQVTRQIDGFKIDYSDTIRAMKDQQIDIDREIVSLSEGFADNYPLPLVIARRAPVQPDDLIQQSVPPNAPIDANDPSWAGWPYPGFVPNR